MVYDVLRPLETCAVSFIFILSRFSGVHGRLSSLVGSPTSSLHDDLERVRFLLTTGSLIAEELVELVFRIARGAFVLRSV